MWHQAFAADDAPRECPVPARRGARRLSESRNYGSPAALPRRGVQSHSVRVHGNPRHPLTAGVEPRLAARRRGTFRPAGPKQAPVASLSDPLPSCRFDSGPRGPWTTTARRSRPSSSSELNQLSTGSAIVPPTESYRTRRTVARPDGSRSGLSPSMGTVARRRSRRHTRTSTTRTVPQLAGCGVRTSADPRPGIRARMAAAEPVRLSG
jgi:hypothetical protein